MAWAIRAGATKLRASTGLCKATSTNVSKVQITWISTLEVRKTRPPRPAPFPYEEKKFGIWNQMFDNTVFRFDDNTKVIVVEGPPAVGKGELCKKLAQELDMKYVPQSVLEDHFVRKFNFDLRTLDDKLPESCRTTSLDTFFKNPTFRNGGTLQFLFYQLRYQKFIQILGHVLSTGQGVVTERSPWSDICFANAMHSNGFLSPNALTLYNIMVQQSLHELLRPHLIIYLDASVKDVQEKIKKRGNAGEINSKVMSEKFLTDLEKNYKYDFLKQMNEHAHILVYDYSQGGDFEVIVEDIETLNFEEDSKSRKFEDWNLATTVQWTNTRRKFVEEEQSLLLDCLLDQFFAEELWVSAADMEDRHFALRKYAPRRVWDSAYVPLGPRRKEFLDEYSY